MKHTIYLPDHSERLLESLMDLDHSEHPGTEPKMSRVIADALVAYSMHRTSQHFKARGMSDRTRAKVEALAKALEPLHA
jgi:hypothetical protein